MFECLITSGIIPILDYSEIIMICILTLVKYYSLNYVDFLVNIHVITRMIITLYNANYLERKKDKEKLFLFLL